MVLRISISRQTVPVALSLVHPSAIDNTMSHRTPARPTEVMTPFAYSCAAPILPSCGPPK
jgi:hypothetical protein